jgi:transposase
VLPEIQKNLATQSLIRAEQIVDAGYMSADRLLTSQSKHAVDLIGPVADDPSWQAKAGEGFGAAHFVLDWEAKQARCPQGKSSEKWVERQDRYGHAGVQITFGSAECRKCPMRESCTRSASQGRSLLVREREHYEALRAARERQKTEVFKATYAKRAGIEGTLSQGVHIGDLRRSRYVGLAKTRLMHLVLGAALNFMRVAAWLAEAPRSRTRVSSFAALGGAFG